MVGVLSDVILMRLAGPDPSGCNAVVIERGVEAAIELSPTARDLASFESSRLVSGYAPQLPSVRSLLRARLCRALIMRLCG